MNLMTNDQKMKLFQQQQQQQQQQPKWSQNIAELVKKNHSAKFQISSQAQQQQILLEAVGNSSNRNRLVKKLMNIHQMNDQVALAQQSSSSTREKGPVSLEDRTNYMKQKAMQNYQSTSAALQSLMHQNRSSSSSKGQNHPPLGNHNHIVKPDSAPHMGFPSAKTQQPNFKFNFTINKINHQSNRKSQEYGSSNNPSQIDQLQNDHIISSNEDFDREASLISSSTQKRRKASQHQHHQQQLSMQKQNKAHGGSAVGSSLGLRQQNKFKLVRTYDEKEDQLKDEEGDLLGDQDKVILNLQRKLERKRNTTLKHQTERLDSKSDLHEDQSRGAIISSPESLKNNTRSRATNEDQAIRQLQKYTKQLHLHIKGIQESQTAKAQEWEVMKQEMMGFREVMSGLIYQEQLDHKFSDYDQQVRRGMDRLEQEVFKDIDHKLGKQTKRLNEDFHIVRQDFKTELQQLSINHERAMLSYDQEIKKDIAKMIKMDLDQERANTKKGLDALKMAFEQTVRDIESTLGDQHNHTLQLLAENKEHISKSLMSKIEITEEKMRAELRNNDSMIQVRQKLQDLEMSFKESQKSQKITLDSQDEMNSYIQALEQKLLEQKMKDKSRADQVQASMDQIQEVEDKLTSKLNLLIQDINTLKKTKSTEDDTILKYSQLQSQLERIKHDLSRFDSIEERLEEQTEDQKQLATQIEAIRTNMQSQNAEISSSLEQLGSGMQNKIFVMTNKIDQIHQSHDKRLSQLEQKYSESPAKTNQDEDIIDYKLEQLKDELDSKLDKVESVLNDQLSSFKDLLEENQQSNQGLTIIYKEQEYSIQGLKATVSTNEVKIYEIAQKYQEQVKEIAAFKEQLENLKNQPKKIKQIDDLEKLKFSQKQLEDQMKYQENGLFKLENGIASQGTQLSEAMRNIDQLQSKQDSFRKIENELEKRITVQIDDKLSDIRSLIEEMNDHNTHHKFNEELDPNPAELLSRLDTLEHTLNTFKLPSDLDTYPERLTYLESQLTSLSTQVTSESPQHQPISDNSKEIQQLRMLIEEIRNDIEGLQEQAEASLRTRENAQKTILEVERLNTEHEKTTDSLQNLQTQFQDISSQVQVLNTQGTEQVSTIQTQIQQLSVQLSDLSQQKSEFAQTNPTLNENSSTNSLNNKLETLETKITQKVENLEYTFNDKVEQLESFTNDKIGELTNNVDDKLKQLEVEFHTQLEKIKQEKIENREQNMGQNENESQIGLIEERINELEQNFIQQTNENNNKKEVLEQIQEIQLKIETIQNNGQRVEFESKILDIQQILVQQDKKTNGILEKFNSTQNYEERIVKMNLQIQELSSSFQKLLLRVKNIEDSNNTYNNQQALSLVDQAIESLKFDFQDFKNQLDHISSIELVNEIRESLQNEIHELQTQAKDTEQNYEQYLNLIEDLQKGIDELKSNQSNSENVNKLNSPNGESQKLRELIEDNQTQIHDILQVLSEIPNNQKVDEALTQIQQDYNYKIQQLQELVSITRTSRVPPLPLDRVPKFDDSHIHQEVEQLDAGSEITPSQQSDSSQSNEQVINSDQQESEHFDQNQTLNHELNQMNENYEDHFLEELSEVETSPNKLIDHTEDDGDMMIYNNHNNRSDSINEHSLMTNTLVNRVTLDNRQEFEGDDHQNFNEPHWEQSPMAAGNSNQNLFEQPESNFNQEGASDHQLIDCEEQAHESNMSGKIVQHSNLDIQEEEENNELNEENRDDVNEGDRLEQDQSEIGNTIQMISQIEDPNHINENDSDFEDDQMAYNLDGIDKSPFEQTSLLNPTQMIQGSPQEYEDYDFEYENQNQDQDNELVNDEKPQELQIDNSYTENNEENHEHIESFPNLQENHMKIEEPHEDELEDYLNNQIEEQEDDNYLNSYRDEDYFEKEQLNTHQDDDAKNNIEEEKGELHSYRDTKEDHDIDQESPKRSVNSLCDNDNVSSHSIQQQNHEFDHEQMQLRDQHIEVNDQSDNNDSPRLKEQSQIDGINFHQPIVDQSEHNYEVVDQNFFENSHEQIKVENSLVQQENNTKEEIDFEDEFENEDDVIEMTVDECSEMVSEQMLGDELDLCLLEVFKLRHRNL